MTHPLLVLTALGRWILKSAALLTLFWFLSFCLVANYRPDPQHPYRNTYALSPPQRHPLPYMAKWLFNASWFNVRTAGSEFAYGYQHHHPHFSLASIAGAWVGDIFDRQTYPTYAGH